MRLIKWFGKLSIQWILIGLLWLMVGLLFLVPDRSRGNNTNVFSSWISLPTAHGIEFLPSHIENSVLPGTIHGTLILENRSHKLLRHIELSTSCFCTKILSPTTIDSLPPKGHIQVRYQVQSPDTGDLLAMLTAETKGQSIHAQILLHVLSPILEATPQWHLPTLLRRAPGLPSQSSIVVFHPYPNIYRLRISSQIPWLHVEQKMRPNGDFELVYKAEGVAPEGQFAGFLHVSYITPHQRGETDIPIVCSIHSQWRVEPPQYTFGLLNQNEPSPSQAFRIFAYQSLPYDLTVHCSSPLLRAILLNRSSSEATLQIWLQTTHLGEIDAFIQLKGGGKILVSIPISVYVQKS
jgi:hypothetical protein